MKKRLENMNKYFLFLCSVHIFLSISPLDSVEQVPENLLIWIKAIPPRVNVKFKITLKAESDLK